MSTTSSSTAPLPPNYGLFPEVREVPLRGEDGHLEMGLMAITNGEVATLQEAGVSRRHIQRVTDMLDALDEQQRLGRGAESRWALARYLQRAEEGISASRAIVNILHRRLRPRGVLPVQRVPRDETGRWRMFSWIRQYVVILLENLDQHLQTPLQPVDSAHPYGDFSSSEEEPICAGDVEGAGGEESSSRHGARSRSPTRNMSSHCSRGASAATSECAYNSEGELVRISTASSSGEPRGPPPPVPVFPSWVTLEAVGIWRETWGES